MAECNSGYIMKYMLDTNICVYIIEKRYSEVFKHFESNISKNNVLCISMITFAKLMHGVKKSNRQKDNMRALWKFLSLIDILPFDSDAAVEYGEICAYLQSKGKTIGVMDMLIAGHALAQNAILVTNNIREFERVNNLRLENWV